MSTSRNYNSSPSNESPLDIFPPEIWYAIFNNLEDWKDRANCYVTSPLFKDILEERKGEWLFKAVMPYIVDRNREATLKCRLVCRSWANCIDKYFTASKSPLDETNHNQYGARGKNVIWLPPRNDEERQTLDEMRNHSRNPFTGRSVFIAKHSSDPVHPLYPSVPHLEIFFTDFGHHIHHLQIHFPLEKVSDSYKSIFVILSKCQALRSLRILLEMAQNTFNNKENLNGDLTLPEMPCNPSLDTLIFEKHCDSSAIQLQEKLLPVYSAQLKQVQLFGWDVETYSKLKWHKLERLQLLSNLLLYEEVDMVSFLESLDVVTLPNLQQLGLIFQEKVINEESLLKALLDLTHRFPKLHKIYMSFIVTFGVENRHRFQQSLLLKGVKSAATLHTLEINIANRSIVDLCFLRYFTSLKTLQLNMRLEEGVVAVAELEFTYGTQLWQELPNLQTIKLSPFMPWYGSYLKPEQIKIIEYSRRGFSVYNLEEQKHLKTDLRIDGNTLEQ